MNDYEILKGDKYVASRVKLVRRRTNLSFGHHNEEFDENWEEWKPGDQVVWEYEEDRETEPFIIKDISQGYVWFTNGEMTRETNLLRITNRSTK